MSFSFSSGSVNDSVNRRQVLKGVAGAALLAGGSRPAMAFEANDVPNRKNRIRQSIAQWCFSDHWSVEQTIDYAVALDCKSVELIEPKYFPLLQKKGLVCAIGQIDMAPRTYALLKKHAGARASINGATQIRAGVIRPEVIIPIAGATPLADAATETKGMDAGSPVRIIRNPYFGDKMLKCGKVTSQIH